ncbi:MAG: hypothetical protein QM657_09410 [Lacrimispora sp.]|uniref:hypothetical protein n=1 Tax=Lacrimispora sp. TaxID=2719234 RepID=UPI0039E5FBDA
MKRKRRNESYYQYRATCSIRREDGFEDIRNYELDTDILHKSLHFWNKSSHLKQCQDMLSALIFQEDDRVVKYGILQEKLVLVPRFTYEEEKKPPGKHIVLPKLLLAIEALILMIIQSRM